MTRGFRYQKVSIRISHSGQRVYFNTDTHKDYTLLKGIALSVGYTGALYGSTFGFRVDEKEILDESHEAHLLVFGTDIEPNKRMLFLEPTVPILSSKIEGIFTDSSLQGLLGNASYNPSGGIIAKSEVNIKKTYVSGKEIAKFGNFQADSLQSISGTGILGSLTMPVSSGQPSAVYYPYDVKVTLLLTR